MVFSWENMGHSFNQLAFSYPYLMTPEAIPSAAHLSGQLASRHLQISTCHHCQFAGLVGVTAVWESGKECEKMWESIGKHEICHSEVDWFYIIRHVVWKCDMVTTRIKLQRRSINPGHAWLYLGTSVHLSLSKQHPLCHAPRVHPCAQHRYQQAQGKAAEGDRHTTVAYFARNSSNSGNEGICKWRAGYLFRVELC